MITYLIFFLFLLLLFHYIFFLFGILKGLKKLAPIKIKKSIHEFISVIIPFRNESENILQNLKSIELQDYPKDKFEIIYVNDLSEDDSYEKLCKNNISENITVISVPNINSSISHKKRAVKYGIENSKGEIIVTTDADCFHSNNWLKNLLSTFDETTGFVSGPVEFIDDDSLFSKLQKIEFAGLIISGAGLIGNNNPVICNAANAAYRKKVYEEVNGFDDQLHLSSGDDEILMQKIAKNSSYKVKFSLSRDAVVTTNANKSIRQFYQQRKRWASKSLFYFDKYLQLKLVLIFLFYLGMLLQIFLIFFYSNIFLISLLISLSAKILMEYLILHKGTELLFTKSILRYFVLAELLHIPYIIISSISGLLGNLIWKDRKIKR